jgi:hypothetical protein
MANKYILNPDGSIQKYTEEGLETVKNNAEPAIKQRNSRSYDALKINEGQIDLDSLDNTVGEILEEIGSFFGSDDANINESDFNEIVTRAVPDSSFGFKTPSTLDSSQNPELKSVLSFRPFNSFADVTEDSKPKVFANEFEILGGIKSIGIVDDDSETGSHILQSLFSYFAESTIRLLIVEAIVLANRAVNIANGQQNRTAERFTLRVGRYDYTEFDLFTRYIYNVLNYPHDNSNLFERVSAYFIGFSEWLAPDSVIDFKEIVKETTTDKNDLDFLASITTVGDNRSILFPFVDVLTMIAYSVVVTLIAGATNTNVQNRANLLIRKFFQEKVWIQNNLYSAKEKESEFLDVFTDLNYYYFKFYIERIQVGLKIINKYFYDDSYLRGREKDSPISRVSALRSNRHIDFAIRILSDEQGNSITGDQEAALAAADKKIKKEKIQANAIKVANNLLPDYLQLPVPPVGELNLKYGWHQKNSNGQISKSHRVTRNKKPGQTTRIRALPQLLSMHPSLYKALAANGKPSINLGEDLTQNFYQLSKKEKRIPASVVTEVEKALEAEYMPFYFHDIRTNEILSFHAFIESITDSFNPEYNSSSGFGRIDDVRTYVKTTRNINVSFTLAATSESDHDLMWYQINKIVAMVYPQWSDGYDVSKSAAKTDFKYPFTQVPTASPLIRLRVGDVITSNYSRTNLSRIHGVGERNADEDTGFNDASASKKENYELLPGLYRLDNGDKGLDLFPNGTQFPTPKSVTLNHPVAIKEIKDEHGDFYEVEIDNPFHKELSAQDLLKIPPDLPSSETIVVVADASKIIVKNKIPNKITTAAANTAKDLMEPTNSEGRSNNPITKSYESGMSKGLAGFITQLDVNYNEVNWETSRIGSKAPMLVKITVNFAPVHDIPPGLDHNGMLRAPVYNVGRINNEFFGDPKDFSYTGSGRDRALAKYKQIDNLNRIRYIDQYDSDT